MAYSQWTVVTAVGGAGAVTVNRSATSPIEDSFSWENVINAPGAGDRAAAGLLLTTGGDITSGRVDLLHYSVSAQVLGAGRSPAAAGMVASAALNANCYSVRYISTTQIALYRGRIDRTSETQLATFSLGYTVAHTSIYALGLKWQRDSDTGDVLLTPYISPGVVGTPAGYLYADVTSPGNFVDNSASKLSTAATCGAASSTDTNGNTITFRMDRVRVQRV